MLGRSRLGSNPNRTAKMADLFAVPGPGTHRARIPAPGCGNIRTRRPVSRFMTDCRLVSQFEIKIGHYSLSVRDD